MDNGDERHQFFFGVGQGDINGTEIHDNCFHFPSWVSNVPQLPFVLFQVQLLVVFCVTQLFHRLLFQHVGMPPLVSQLLAGLALGYSGLGRYKEFLDAVFSSMNGPVVKPLVLLAFSLYLFQASTQTDVTIVKRTGKKNMMIGLFAIISSLIMNIVTLKLLNPSPDIQKDLTSAVTSLPVTSFPVIIQLLSDMKLVNSELGRLSLATGIVLECMSIMLTMAVYNIVPAIGDRAWLLASCVNLLGVGVVIVVLIFVFRPFVKFLVRITPKDRPIKDSFLLLAFVLSLMIALVTDFLGQFIFLGSLLAGFAIPDGPPFGSAMVDTLDSLFSDLLFPSFVTLAAMRIDVSSINFEESLVYGLMILMAVTTLTKVSVCFVGGILNKMGRRDSLALAFLLSCKGFLEMSSLTVLRDMGVISGEYYSVMALYIILMAAFVPMMVKCLYDPMRKYAGYQIRDVIHLKPNSNLKMVACVLRPDNTSSITNLLGLLNPTRNVPINAYILHLVKLVGRCQPMLISHAMQKKQSSYHLFSDEVIWHFDHLQSKFSDGSLSAQVFTALAKVESMHEYLCTLALDKVVSLIVLPFHRKFGIEGFVDVNDNEQRLLNTSVLARSPCSIAILVDRSHVNNIWRINGSFDESSSVVSCVQDQNHGQDQPLLSVGLVFIGGNDDLEALAFARRMSRGKRIRLNVIRLALPGDKEEFSNSLDAKAIDRFLHEDKFDDINPNVNQITYSEVTVKDGLETLATLRAMVHEYQLMIVGRRNGQDTQQTTGLEESCEIKELGIIGDLLATPDLKCRTSVLVVQQQHQNWG